MRLRQSMGMVVRSLAMAVATMGLLALSAAGESASPPDEVVTVNSPQSAPGKASSRQLRLVRQGDKVLPRYILKAFDFDEQRYGNHESVPMHWVRRQGPNLPHFNKGEFDFEVGHEAAPSFRLHSITDSVAFTYSRNDIPVEPGNRYLVTAWVRTKNLKKNQAYVSAAYMTRDLSVMEGTEMVSDPVSGANPEGQWYRLELPTCESPRGARFLQVSVWLAEPGLRDQQTDGSPRPIAQQDADVTAWFDDIEVTLLLPLPSIRAEGDIPVFQANQPVQLTGPRVNPAHFGLACRITVSDESGATYYETQTDPRRLGDAPPKLIRLDDLPSGLYTGRLQVLSQDRQITEQQVRFVKLPELVRTVPGQIGVCLNEAALKAPQATMACIRGMGACSVKIPIWTQSTTDAQIAVGQPGGEDLLKRVLAEGLEPVGMLVSPPGGLASRLLPVHGTLVDLFSASQLSWQPYLALSLTHYADIMRLWQIGMDGQEDLAADSRFRPAAELAASQIVTLIDGAQVTVAWPAQETLARPIPNVERISLCIPDSVRPDQIPPYISQYSQTAKGVRVTLQPLQDRRYSPSVRRADLAQRIVHALAGGAEMVFALQPWEMIDAGDQTLAAPTFDYTTWATLSRALAGKRYAGRFVWSNGAVFHIFCSDEDATLVAWDQQPGEPGRRAQPVTLYLGERVTACDLRGRSVPLPGKEAQTVPISPEPIVITGVNSHLARMRSLFDVQPRQVASGLRAHQQTVTLANPYNEPINGVVRLRGPEGWQITPSRLSFALSPGEAMQQKVEIRVPSNEPIGPKTLTADLSIDAQRFHQMSIPVTLDLQLPGINTYAFTDSIAGDLIIRHVLTNNTNEELNFIGSVLLPQAVRQERLFLHLHPGQTMVKEYIIPGTQVEGESQLRLSLREINGPRLLNQIVDLF